VSIYRGLTNLICNYLLSPLAYFDDIPYLQRARGSSVGIPIGWMIGVLVPEGERVFCVCSFQTTQHHMQWVLRTLSRGKPAGA
jgi:hypothetical protein